MLQTELPCAGSFAQMKIAIALVNMRSVDFIVQGILDNWNSREDHKMRKYRN